MATFDNAKANNFFQFLANKIEDHKQLVKFKLNLTVVFSALFGYLMAMGGSFEWLSLLMLSAGGFFVTSSANAINQIIEKDYDKLMKRTANRPLSAGRMELPEAVLIAGTSGVLGLLILWHFFNPLAALLGAISLIAYAFIYTPLKRISPIAVLVGAIPGALPVLIGWIAATGAEGWNTYAFLLFGIQFLWQFPHFWAIGWMGYDDYKKAGFKLLPLQYEARNKQTATHIIIYTIAVVLVSLLPVFIGMCGYYTAAAVILLGGYFIYTTLKLWQNCDHASALKVMFASILFLPLTQIVMVLDKV